MKGEVAHHPKVGSEGESFVSHTITFAHLKILKVDFLVELCKGASLGRGPHIVLPKLSFLFSKCNGCLKERG